MRISTYFETRWFKKRYLFALQPSTELQPVEIDEKFFLETTTDEPNSGLHITYFSLMDKITQSEAARTIVTCNGSDRVYWHDNVPIFPGGSLIYRSFVEPDFRGNNLYVMLLKIVSNHFVQHTQHKPEMFYAVVEKRNIPSIRSHQKAGYTTQRNNYLVKLNGRNILTIFTHPFICYNATKNRDRF